MNNEFCPCCSNNCSKDNLRCNRGREYFNNSGKNSEPETIEEQVLMDLRRCGHLLHHNKELNTKEVLSSFTEKELENLHQLLIKFYNNTK